MSVQVRGQHREGIATPHPDPGDVAQYIETFLDRHGTDVARRLGIRIHGSRKPTLDELKAGVRGTVVIDIELTDDKLPVR